MLTRTEFYRFRDRHFGERVRETILTVSKFEISQSEALCTILISYDIKSLTWYPTWYQRKIFDPGEATGDKDFSLIADARFLSRTSKFRGFLSSTLKKINHFQDIISTLHECYAAYTVSMVCVCKGGDLCWRKWSHRSRARLNTVKRN